MSKDYPPKIEKEINHAYLVGQSEGLMQAGGWLTNKAIELFKAGQDDKAEMIRDWALELSKMAEVRRKS